MPENTEFEFCLQRNGFARHNGVQIRQIGENEAEAWLEMSPEVQNPYGVLHGGAFYTLADCAGGNACRTDGRSYVTIHGGLNFIHAVREGRVTAHAQVTHRGRTTCLTAITIMDQQGRTLAMGEFTFFCVGAGASAGGK